MNKSRQHFDKITILLHWGMALLIFFLFGLGLYMVDLSYYDPWYRDSTALHKSIGVGVFILLVLRVLWRIFYVNKYVQLEASNELKPIERLLALMMHCVLYVLIAVICLSGYMISTAGGREMDVFSLFSLPALPVEMGSQEDLAGWWHFYLAWGIIVLVFGHTLAALKHHFIDKNNILKSMFWSSKTKKGDS